MDIKKFIEYLYNKKSYQSDGEIAQYLGTKQSQLSIWKTSNKTLSDREIYGLINRTRQTAISEAQQNTIRPIVEFCSLNAVESRSGKKLELFSTGTESSLLYRGLRETLEKTTGIYVFYDTRGRALYTGKAKEQSLWSEMKNVFNRERRTQQVFRVAHPTRNQSFQTAADLPRTITRTEVLLADMAAYFSAYDIASEMIDSFEALIVRAFANDLLNSRMERF